MSIDTSVGRVQGFRVSIDTSVQVSGQGSSFTRLRPKLDRQLASNARVARSPTRHARVAAPSSLSRGWVTRSTMNSRVAHPTPVWPPRRSLRFNDLNDEAKQAVKDAAGSGVHIKF